MTRFGKFFNWLKAFGAELKSPTTSIPIVVCICCLMYIHWYRADPEYGNAATKVVTCMIAFVVFLISFKNILLTNEKHKGEHGVRFRAHFLSKDGYGVRNVRLKLSAGALDRQFLTISIKNGYFLTSNSKGTSYDVNVTVEARSTFETDALITKNLFNEKDIILSLHYFDLETDTRLEKQVSYIIPASLYMS